MKNLISACVIGLGVVSLVGCGTDAQIASQNLAEAAEQFQIKRRIVFFNGITDKYLLEIVGNCSIEAQSMQNQLEVTCKVGDGDFKKHHLGLSDNVSYFSEQIDGKNVSTYHYKVVFRPQSIIPDVDLKVDAEQLNDLM